MEKKPTKPTKAYLLKKLQVCIDNELYEYAAELRDIIKDLYGPKEIR